jgi:hypothetical protein
MDYTSLVCTAVVTLVVAKVGWWLWTKKPVEQGDLVVRLLRDENPVTIGEKVIYLMYKSKMWRWCYNYGFKITNGHVSIRQAPEDLYGICVTLNDDIVNPQLYAAEKSVIARTYENWVKVESRRREDEKAAEEKRLIDDTLNSNT